VAGGWLFVLSPPALETRDFEVGAMGSGKDTSSRKLSELFRERRTSRELAERFFEDDYFKPEQTSLSRFFDYKNDEIFLCLSRIALQLRDDDDRSLIKAFEEAGLDPQNPLHWRELFSIFAEVHFGPMRTKPQKWDSVALSEVLDDYRTIKSENPKAKEPALRKALREDKRFKKKYEHYNMHSFRKLLRHAKSPSTNVLLRHPEMRDPLLQLIRDGYEGKSIQLTPQREALVKGLVERFSAALDLKDKT
jgi:hypothetical protein